MQRHCNMEVIKKYTGEAIAGGDVELPTVVGAKKRQNKFINIKNVIAWR